MPQLAEKENNAQSSAARRFEWRSHRLKGVGPGSDTGPSHRRSTTFRLNLGEHPPPELAETVDRSVRARLLRVMAGECEPCTASVLRGLKLPASSTASSYWMSCIDRLLRARNLTHVAEPGYTSLLLRQLGGDLPSLFTASPDRTGRREASRLASVLLADLIADHLA